MEDVKYCPKCGEKLPIDAIYCQKCGYKNKSENVLSNIGSKTLKNKSIIAVAILAIIIIGFGAYYVSLPKYEFDKFNELIEKSNYEISEAEKLEVEYNLQTSLINSKIENIDWMTQTISAKQNNDEIIKDTIKLSDASRLILEKEKTHYRNAELFYYDMKYLNLPNDYYDYIDKKIYLLKKKQSYLDTFINSIQTRNKFREFMKYYTEGDIYRDMAAEQIGYAEDSYSISASKSYIDRALSYVDLCLNRWKSANNVIPATSLSNDIKALECFRSSLVYFSNSLGRPYYDPNSFSLSNCKSLSGLVGIMPEIDSWNNKNISPLEEQSNDIYKEIIALEEETERMWNNLSNN